MEGAALREQQAYDLMIAQAWHTEAFAREKKLKKLSQYQSKSQAQKRSPVADAAAFFHRLKASGVPVEISRVVH
jgi:hypothetical protein